MRHILLSFGLILSVVFTNAQIVIKGRVLAESSDVPVINASVYLNNTSIGTITNKNGEFTLNAGSIYTGELVISSVGFQPLFYKLNTGDATNKFYTFKLEIKERTLRNIAVMNDVTRQSWLKIFKDNFLGITEEADNCKIENLDAVYFAVGDDKGTMFAYADTPLIIKNKLLGYKISFDLIEFSYNKTNSATYYAGYNRYDELGDKKRWIKRRRQNYFGSTVHFYRSLIANKLTEEGYSMFEVKKLLKDTGAAKSKKSITINSHDLSVAIPLPPGKILFTDTASGNYYLQSENQVMVRYKKSPHLRFNPSGNWFIQGLEHPGFQSFIILLADKVALDKNGILFNPLEVLYNGFWVYEKFANQLPFDYVPN